MTWIGVTSGLASQLLEVIFKRLAAAVVGWPSGQHLVQLPRYVCNSCYLQSAQVGALVWLRLVTFCTVKVSCRQAQIVVLEPVLYRSVITALPL